METNESVTTEVETLAEDTTSTPEVEATEPKETTLRETIEKAYDKQTQEEAPSTETESKAASSTRQKDPQTGKFTKGQVKGDLKTLGTVDGVEIPVPISWSKEDAETFKTLPPNVRKNIAEKEAKREQIFNERNMQALNYIKQYEEIDQAFKPIEDQLNLSGTTKGTIVRNFLAWQKKLDENPKQGFKDLAASMGIDIKQLAQEEPEIDPQIGGVVNELNQLKGYLSQQQQQQQNQVLQYQIQSAQNEIVQFASEKDQKGQPLRPHFDALYESGDIQPIAEMLKAANPQAPVGVILQEAYERAKYLNPDVRSKVLDSELQQREAKRIAEMKEKAQKARSLGSSVTGAPGGNLAVTAPKSTREALLQNWERLSGE